jgi:hypothetical protein
MEMDWYEIKKIEDSPENSLAQIDAYYTERALSRKPRRNLYKIATKKARAIRVLRKRRGISQHQESELCGFRDCTW